MRPAAGLKPTRSSFAAFSSAEVVPGIGAGKTSTGIVRFLNLSFVGWLNNSFVKNVRRNL